MHSRSKDELGAKIYIKSNKVVHFNMNNQSSSIELKDKNTKTVKMDDISSQDEVNPLDEEREFDVIIFAASGCVGKFLVEELSLVVDKYYTGQQANLSSQKQHQFAQQALRRRSVPSSSSIDNELAWAVAGRSAVKLSETLCRAELITGIKNLSSSVPVILADLNHQKSLSEMCRKTRLIINCAGPYSELGAEVLIQTCLDSKTDYIDLAHEVTFLDSMRQKYSSKARQAGVFILSGCGFQSMSAEMGLNFTKQVAGGTIEQVKIILSLSDTSALIKSPNKKERACGIISEGMWNSLLAEKAQEVSVEDRLAKRVTANRLAAIEHQRLSNHEEENKHREEELDADQIEESKKLLAAHRDKQEAGPSRQSTSNSIVNSLSDRTRSLTDRILQRKDTQTLVKDIVQFRNRSVSLAWPMRLIQGLQGKSGRGYCWPIDNMSSDESQLIRSEMNNYELRRPDLDSIEGWRPIRCSTFLSVKNFTQLICLFIWLFFFQILVKFSLFRFAMRKLPQLASLGHVISASSINSSNQLGQSMGKPTIERSSLSHIKYCQTFIAYGAPSDDSGDPLEKREKYSMRKQTQLLVSRIVGPEPNHVATATFGIQAAMTLLTERAHIPCSGGVLTPGAAFSDTNIIYQLRKRNIKFEVLKKA